MLEYITIVNRKSVWKRGDREDCPLSSSSLPALSSRRLQHFVTKTYAYSGLAEHLLAKTRPELPYIQSLGRPHSDIMSPVVTELLFNSAFGFYAVGLFHSVVALVSKRELFYRVATASVAVGFTLHSAFLIYSGIEKAHFPLPWVKGSASVVTSCTGL